MVERFVQLWKKLDISNDGFIRTTDPEHIRYVQSVLADLQNKNEISTGVYQGWYCVPCERYCTDKDVIEGACPDCRRPVERLEEKNYFFRLSRRQNQLADLVQSDRLTILPATRKNEVLGFLQQPLMDLCISRPRKRLAWGIPLPFDPEFVTYVWFDALLNYISATIYAPRLAAGPSGPRPPLWEESEVLHLIGKDILKPPHAIYWPAMLMAMGKAAPSRIVAHGWWTVEGQKMSKSLGNAIDPNAIVESYGVDAFRYFLLREVPFGQDGDFSASALIGRINHDLADEFGNLVGRMAAMARQKDSGDLFPSAYPADASSARRQEFLFESIQAVETLQFSLSLTVLADLFSDLNKKINDDRPWESAEDLRRQTLGSCAVDLARGIFLLAPFVPTLAKEAACRLGCGEVLSKPDVLFSDEQIRQSPPWRVSPGAPLVVKIDTAKDSKASAVASAPGRPPVDDSVPIGVVIDITDFQKIDLRTARIISAERVSGSEKLLKLSVAVGPDEADRRQIVAGIGRRYAPEELIGKTVVVVSNLKPRKVFGVESHGMLLAAGAETSLHLVTLDGDIPPGTRIK